MSSRDKLYAMVMSEGDGSVKSHILSLAEAVSAWFAVIFRQESLYIAQECTLNERILQCFGLQKIRSHLHYHWVSAYSGLIAVRICLILCHDQKMQSGMKELWNAVKMQFYISEVFHRNCLLHLKEMIHLKVKVLSSFNHHSCMIFQMNPSVQKP